jgi:hypothetical protein
MLASQASLGVTPPLKKKSRFNIILANPFQRRRVSKIDKMEHVGKNVNEKFYMNDLNH